MAKHPERRPLTQVEGAIHTADLAGNRLEIHAASTTALRPLIAVLAKTAERLRQERTHEEKAA